VELTNVKHKSSNETSNSIRRLLDFTAKILVRLRELTVINHINHPPCVVLFAKKNCFMKARAEER
jgi:hypothetical protein